MTSKNHQIIAIINPFKKQIIHDLGNKGINCTLSAPSALFRHKRFMLDEMFFTPSISTVLCLRLNSVRFWQLCPGNCKILSFISYCISFQLLSKFFKASYLKFDKSLQYFVL